MRLSRGEMFRLSQGDMFVKCACIQPNDLGPEGPQARQDDVCSGPEGKIMQVRQDDACSGVVAAASGKYL